MIDSSLYHTRIETLRRPVSTFLALALGAALLFTQPVHIGAAIYEVMEMAGFLMIFVAVLGRMWCILYIGGRKNRELCRIGPYAISRNPLYFFSFVGLMGVCIGAQNAPAALVAGAAFLGGYHWVMRMEETRLDALFGADFRDYCAVVPRFWPRWPEPLVAHKIEVDGRAFTRALTEVFWFLFAIILVEGLEMLKAYEWWPRISMPF
ncbi:MAG TPA: isoprenylcysteine carboxylmethyltransferase family protein [Roseimicrobium sp.]|nr:isoprenylcysteine carboxylmethyltransferase family protein [Roseimicrobium sp.]